METILLTLAAIAGAGALVFAAHRLGQAHSRIDLLRHQRQRDSKLQR
jgi:hypothetical protein